MSACGSPRGWIGVALTVVEHFLELVHENAHLEVRGVATVVPGHGGRSIPGQARLEIDVIVFQVFSSSSQSLLLGGGLKRRKAEKRRVCSAICIYVVKRREERHARVSASKV